MAAEAPSMSAAEVLTGAENALARVKARR